MENDKYTSIVERKGKQIYIPDILLRAAGIEEGDLVEISIKKINQVKK